jgi:hypothetical protein
MDWEVWLSIITKVHITSSVTTLTADLVLYPQLVFERKMRSLDLKRFDPIILKASLGAVPPRSPCISLSTGETSPCPSQPHKTIQTSWWRFTLNIFKLFIKRCDTRMRWHYYF